MTRPVNTYQTIVGLGTYLKDNNYFDGINEEVVSQKILASWDAKFRTAITVDVKSKFNSIEIEFERSTFELISEDHQGACLFCQQVIFSDKMSAESIKVSIKTLIGYNKTTICLDSIYATVDKWGGESEQLKKIFTRLKTANKKSGYFDPISLTDLLR